MTKVLVFLLCKKPTDHRTVHDISHVSLGNVFSVWSVVLFTKLYCCVHVGRGGVDNFYDTLSLRLETLLIEIRTIQ